MSEITKIDDRQSRMHIFPLYMGLVLVALIVPIIWGIYSVFREDFGDEHGRKIQILGLFIVWLLGCLYGFVAFIQIIVTERREKFIVWRTTIKNDGKIELDGLFSKTFTFQKNDISVIYRYKFKKFRELGTLLDWRSGVYVLELKNGKSFFFSNGFVQEILPYTSIAKILN